MTQLLSLVSRVLDEYSSRPPDALFTHAARALFDFETCAAAGRRMVRDSFAGDVAAAAAAGSAFDLEDVHWPSITHAGPIVWPAVLSACAEADASGADAVRAAAVGYEITARLANMLGGPHRQFWHATTTAGTVGAAAAAATALDLDTRGTADAAAHAACVAGGIAQSLIERSGTRVFYRAHAAATGVAAARAAQAGLSPTREALEGPKGLFAATAGGAPATAPSFAGGPRFAIEELWFRVHPATGFAHTAADAAASLGPVPRDAARSIHIEAPAAAVTMAGNVAPQSREDAWWSIPYVVAVALLHGNAGAIDLRQLLDVSDLLARTTIVAGESDLAATVVVDVEGDERSATAAFPTGHPERPLDDVQRLAKWQMLEAGSAEDGRMLFELSGRLSELSVREYLASRPPTAVPLVRK